MNDKKRLVKVEEVYEESGIAYLRVVGAVRITPQALDFLLSRDEEQLFFGDDLHVTIYLSGSGELEVDVEKLTDA